MDKDTPVYVTNKTLYDELNGIRKEFPGRRELYLSIGAMNTVAVLVAKYGIPSPKTLENVNTALTWFPF